MLETLWYLVIGVSVLFYVILDGFDLGVGALHLFAKNDMQRRIFLNAIGPVWDGNEVWIVIVMGGLFAGFPNAYATIFSGFYELLMFLIAGFIFRAAAIEFRSKREAPYWRSFWDVVFAMASILVALALGLILGNLIEGVPLNEQQEYMGGFVDFFKPYSILVAVTFGALLAMHGAIYLNLKTEGEAHEVLRRWIHPAILVFLSFYLLTTLATVLFKSHMLFRFKETPYFLIFPILTFIAIANIPRQIKKGNDGWAFIFSCISIAFLFVLYAFGSYPVIVPSTIHPMINSLTIYNTASSHNTLINLLIVVVIGIPLVLAYGFLGYRIFRGKTKIDKISY